MAPAVSSSSETVLCASDMVRADWELQLAPGLNGSFISAPLALLRQISVRYD